MNPDLRATLDRVERGLQSGRLAGESALSWRPGAELRATLERAVGEAVDLVGRRAAGLGAADRAQQLAELRSIGRAIERFPFHVYDGLAVSRLLSQKDQTALRAIVAALRVATRRAEVEANVSRPRPPQRALLLAIAALLVVTRVSMVPLDRDPTIRSAVSDHLAIAQAAIARAEALNVEAAGANSDIALARVQMAQGALAAAASALTLYAQDVETRPDGDASATWAVAAPLARGVAYVDSLLAREVSAARSDSADVRRATGVQRSVIEASRGTLTSVRGFSPMAMVRAPMSLPIPRALLLGVGILAFASAALSVTVWIASGKTLDLTKIIEVLLESVKSAGGFATALTASLLIALPAGAVVAGRALDSEVQTPPRDPPHSPPADSADPRCTDKCSERPTTGGASVTLFAPDTLEVRVRIDPVRTAPSGRPLNPAPDSLLIARLDSILRGVNRANLRLSVRD